MTTCDSSNRSDSILFGVLLLIAILGVAPHEASAYSASGKVCNYDSSAVAGVVIRSSLTKLSATTDSSGNWSLEIPDGNASIKTRSISFNRMTTNILENQDGHIRIAISGTDVSGRLHKQNNSRLSKNKFALRELQMVDTLEYSYNDTIFLRDTITTSQSGLIRFFDKGLNSTVIHGYLTDSRDGQVYRTIKVGKSVWMAQNLNIKVDSSFCFNDHYAVCYSYGRLYNWAAAMNENQIKNSQGWGGWYELHQGICPKGWHIPNKYEWNDFLTTAIDSAKAGKTLKSKYEWQNETTNTDSIGFRVLPVGIRSYSAIGSTAPPSYTFIHEAAFFWSANDNSTSDYATVMWFKIGDNSFQQFDYGKKINGYSLRCVQD